MNLATKRQLNHTNNNNNNNNIKTTTLTNTIMNTTKLPKLIKSKEGDSTSEVSE
ncbi:unnamed protein product [Trichobilharzia regenti]|nr:unnamed protein product [Trichobilharzia regenti]